MTFYWRLKDIPELRDVPVKDRREWWREAVVRSRTSRVKWVFFTVMLISLIGVSTLVHHMGWGVLARFGCYAVVGATLGLIQEISYQQPHAREWLRLHINDESLD